MRRASVVAAFVAFVAVGLGLVAYPFACRL